MVIKVTLVQGICNQLCEATFFENLNDFENYKKVTVQNFYTIIERKLKQSYIFIKAKLHPLSVFLNFLFFQRLSNVYY